MTRLALLCLCLVLYVVPAHAVQQVVLAWQYVAAPGRPGSLFVVQRCESQNSVCVTAMETVSGELPITTLTWTDQTAVENVVYCYQVLTGDPYGRSVPSNPACGFV